MDIEIILRIKRLATELYSSISTHSIFQTPFKISASERSIALSQLQIAQLPEIPSQLHEMYHLQFIHLYKSFFMSIFQLAGFLSPDWQWAKCLSRSKNTFPHFGHVRWQTRSWVSKSSLDWLLNVHFVQWSKPDLSCTHYFKHVGQ